MDYSLTSLVLLFFIYSVIGWALETFFCSVEQKKLVARGFLFGPYCPVYGFGTLLILMATDKVGTGVGAVFWASMITCTVVEYFTSYLMEKIFHIRWWDYTEADRFNLNGRICLRNSLLFGIGGCAIVFWAQPKVALLLSLIPKEVLSVIAIVILVAMSIDTMASYAATKYAGKTIDFGKLVGDQTNEIKKQARKAVKQFVKKTHGGKRKKTSQ